MGLSSPEGSQGDSTVSSLSIQILKLYLEMLNSRVIDLITEALFDSSDVMTSDLTSLYM